jgi:WD40 repeat protein
LYFGGAGLLFQWPVKGSNPPRALTNTANIYTSMAFGPDDAAFAFGDEQGILHLWSMKTRAQLSAIKAHDGRIQSVAWSPDGKLLASTGDDQTVRVWDAQTDKSLAILDDYQASIARIAFSPNGKTLAVLRAVDIRQETLRLELWAVPTGALAIRFADSSSFHPDFVPYTNRLAFSPDGSLLATESGVWDVKTGQLTGQWRTTFAAFSPDSKTLVAFKDSTCKQLVLLDLATLSEREHFPASGCPQELLFSPDGTHLAWCGINVNGEILDMATGKETSVDDSCDFGALAFSPDSQLLAIGGDYSNGVDLWEVKTGALHLRIDAHDAELNGVQFSHDGNLVFSSGSRHDESDMPIHAWDVATGGQVTRLNIPSENNGFDWTHQVRAVAMSPDGTLFASAGDDGTVVLWGVQ